MEAAYVSHIRRQPWSLGQSPFKHAELYPPAETLPYFTKADGYISGGGDIYQSVMSLAQAERAAVTLPGCAGFTFENKEMNEKGQAKIFFKRHSNVKRTVNEVRDARAPGTSGETSPEEVSSYHVLADPEPWTSYILEVPEFTQKPNGGDSSLMKMSGLKKGKKTPKELKDENQARAWATINGFTFSFVAILFFIVMEINWFFMWHRSIFWFAVFFVLCLVAASGLMLYGAQRKTRRHILVIGILCLFVTMLGLVCGFFWYFRYLAYYFRYMEMRRYTNVGASEEVKKFNDGSMFLFSQDTRLDVLRSVGYKSMWSGDDMCVAPIVDGIMTNANTVGFWAVGDDCCMARSNFLCGDAHDPKAMSALVMLEPEEVVRPFMKWAVRNSVYPRYERAIKLQESAFATRAAKNMKLVYWVKDPIAKRDSFYYDARTKALWTTAILYAILLCGSYLVCYHYRYKRALHDQHVTRDFKRANSEAKKAPPSTEYSQY